MLTRLRVQGFKNLADADIQFGPFNCVAGVNASGKSNLFDVIMFLKDLSNYSIVEAASRIRDVSTKRRGDLMSIFTIYPNGEIRDMCLEAEFLVSKQVKDDFDRPATPSATHLKYRVELRYVPSVGDKIERIELVHESLTYIPKTLSRKRLGFKHSSDFWNSVIGGAKRSDFISTEKNEAGLSVIKLRQDGHQGRSLDVLAANSPRTILGTINTDDKPTALAARREMQSWKLLQLEPSKLRLPDDFSDESVVSPEGEHLPAALARIKKYSEVANRLSSLLPDVRTVNVDIDEGRRLKTLTVEQRDGSVHAARNLSDGTLRFLALAVIGADESSGGVICLEEPENGIHPSRVTAMMQLLGDIAVNPAYAVDESNPLRQVIINTHSPIVVGELRVDDLLVALPIRKKGLLATVFAPIPGSWRATLETTPPQLTVPLGSLIAYLSQRDEKYAEDDRIDASSTVSAYIQGQLQLF